MQRVRDSVSVVLKCKDEIVLVKRRPNLFAFPGYDAFPGGKVEQEDKNTDNYHNPWNGLVEDIFVRAAFREIQEELSIDLESEYKSGNILSITKLCEFTTPPFNPVRFKNRTLLVELKEKIEITLCERELASGGWETIVNLNKLQRNGMLLTVPPVRIIFEKEMEPLLIKREYELLEENYLKPIFMIEPMKEFYQILVPSNTIPPATNTNCFLLGGMLVDPSPKNEEVLEELLKFLEDKNVEKVFITHHHRDHHQFLDRILDKLKVPVLMSEYTFEKLNQKYIFENVHIIGNREVVSTWLDHDVLTYHVPGHDQGQMALYSSNLKWMIVGDLIQGIGTVVIPTEEGDMGLYFQSLQNCIDLNPNVIIPSHGIAMGGTFYLQKTLDHRKIREEQVMNLLNEGKSVDEMLPIIYKGVDKRLYPLAKENILSHIKKINSDQDRGHDN